MPSEILENIFLYCVISLANFDLLFLYNERIRFFCFVTVVLAKIATSDLFNSILQRVALGTKMALFQYTKIQKTINNRPQHEALGKKPHKLKHCIYSPEPRAEVHCFRLNFNLSKLVYWSIRQCERQETGSASLDG